MAVPARVLCWRLCRRADLREVGDAECAKRAVEVHLPSGIIAHDRSGVSDDLPDSHELPLFLDPLVVVDADLNDHREVDHSEGEGSDEKHPENEVDVLHTPEAVADRVEVSHLSVGFHRDEHEGVPRDLVGLAEEGRGLSISINTHEGRSDDADVHGRAGVLDHLKHRVKIFTPPLDFVRDREDMGDLLEVVLPPVVVPDPVERRVERVRAGVALTHFDHVDRAGAPRPGVWNGLDSTFDRTVVMNGVIVFHDNDHREHVRRDRSLGARDRIPRVLAPDADNDAHVGFQCSLLAYAYVFSNGSLPKKPWHPPNFGEQYILLRRNGCVNLKHGK